MSLVFRASTNVYFSGNKHILRFFNKGLPSSLFFNSENLLSSIDQCTGSFIQTFKTRRQVIMVLPAPPLERDYMKENRIYLFFLFIFLIINFLLLLPLIIVIVFIIIITIIIIMIIIIILFKFFTLFSK